MSHKTPPSPIPLRRSISGGRRAASPKSQKVQNPPMIFKSSSQGGAFATTASGKSTSPYRSQNSLNAAHSSPNYARPTTSSSQGVRRRTPSEGVVRETYSSKSTLDATVKTQIAIVEHSEGDPDESMSTSFPESTSPGMVERGQTAPPATLGALRASIVSSRSSTPVSKNRTPSSHSDNSNTGNLHGRLPTPNENRQRNVSSGRSRSPHQRSRQKIKEAKKITKHRLPKELRPSLEVEGITRVGGFPLSGESQMAMDASLKEVFAVSADFVWCLSKSCIYLIDTHTRKVEATLPHSSSETFGLYSCAIPVDNTVWVGTTEGHLHVLDKLTLEPTVEPMVRHHGSINQLIHQQPASAVFSSGVDFTILKWSTETHLVERCFVGHHGSIKFIAIADNGWGNLMSYGDDSQLRFWDTGLMDVTRASSEVLFAKRVPHITALAAFEDTHVWYGTREGEVFVLSPVSEESSPRRVFSCQSTIASIFVVKNSVWVQESGSGKIFVFDGRTTNDTAKTRSPSPKLLLEHQGELQAKMCKVHTSTLDIVWLVGRDGVEELTLSSSAPVDETRSQINATKHILEKCIILEEANDEMQREHIDLKEQLEALKLDNERLKKVISDRSGGDTHQQIIKDLETSRAKAVKACESSAKNIKTLREKEKICDELETRCAEQELMIRRLKDDLKVANLKVLQGEEELKGVVLSYETLKQELSRVDTTNDSEASQTRGKSESPVPHDPRFSVVGLSNGSETGQGESVAIDALRKEVHALNGALEEASEELARERIRQHHQSSNLRDSHVEGHEVGNFLANIDSQLFVAHQALQKASFGIGKAGPGGYQKSVESAFLSLGVIRDNLKKFSNHQPAVSRYLDEISKYSQDQGEAPCDSEEVVRNPSVPMTECTDASNLSHSADLSSSRPAKKPTDAGFESKWRQKRADPLFQPPVASDYFVQSTSVHIRSLHRTTTGSLARGDNPGGHDQQPLSESARVTLPVIQEGDSSPAAPLHEPRGDAPSETVSVVIDHQTQSESSASDPKHLDPEYLRQEY